MSALLKLKHLILGTIIGASLGVLIIPAISIFFAQERLLSLLIMIPFALLLALPPLLAIYKKEFDPFEPIYLWIILYAFLYLLKPLTHVITGVGFRYGGEYLNEALLIAIVGLAFFYLGYFWGVGKKIAEKLPVVAKEISLKKLRWIAWALILLGFWGLHTYIQISGGWFEFWSKPHGFGGKASITTAYIYQLPELMIVGFILLFFAVVTSGKISRVKNLLLLSIAGAGGVGLYTLIWGSRTNFSWLLISCVVLYYASKKRRPSLGASFTVLIFLFLALITIPTYRGYVYFGGDFQKILDMGNYTRSLRQAFGNPTDEFGSYLAEVALVPEDVPYDYFALHRQLIYHPIPRLIWPDKPPLFNRNWDSFLAKSHLSWGAAESLLGDFYAQLGIWGIMIGTFISGVLWKTIYWYFKRDENNMGAMIIFAVVLPNMFTYLAQGSAIAILKWLPYMMPSTVLAIFLSRKIGRSAKS
ncbi:MAG: oligosaccharide repeat unit polymerase [Candidatus Liptonbacteria bacterium]|nr:oligosaccharide repeat unit polymerase [Candidatus Liptonbacteria bacterium]